MEEFLTDTCLNGRQSAVVGDADLRPYEDYSRAYLIEFR